MQNWTRTVKAAEVQQSLRIAGKRAKERLECSTRELSHARDKNLQVSMKKVRNTREALAFSASDLTHASATASETSTGDLGKTRGLLKMNSGISIEGESFFVGVLKAGFLEAAMASAVAKRRMNAPAEAVRLAERE